MAPRALVCTAALLAAVLSGCGSDSGGAADPTTAPPASESPTSSPTSSPASPSATEPSTEKPGTTIKTGDSDFGTMLFGGNDQAIYIWEVEESAKAECYDDCEEAWPPVLTKGEPVAEGEVDATLLGTTKRKDGSLQVTYNGHPLYYYAHEGPGEVKCHNVSTHGGLWWVVQPDGDRAP